MRLKILLTLFIFSLIHFQPLQGSKAPPSQYKYELTACMIFKNEAPWLKEWIEYHRIVGVQHFFLYNNNSTDNYAEVLKPYTTNGIVTLIDWPFGDEMNYIYQAQVPAYKDALSRFRSVTKWMAIIDSDEFLVPVKAKSLLKILPRYEDFGGLCTHWKFFGTSFVSKINQNELMIEKLVLREVVDPVNVYFKTIVRPDRVDVNLSNDVHGFVYNPGFFAVNSQKSMVQGSYSPPFHETIQLNHYWTRDEDYFFNHKIPRRMAWTGDSLESFYVILDRLNNVKDKKILRFAPELRKRMGLENLEESTVIQP